MFPTLCFSLALHVLWLGHFCFFHLHSFLILPVKSLSNLVFFLLIAIYALHFRGLFLDPRSQRAGSYKFGAVIVIVSSVSESVSQLVS